MRKVFICIVVFILLVAGGVLTTLNYFGDKILTQGIREELENEIDNNIEISQNETNDEHLQKGTQHIDSGNNENTQPKESNNKIQEEKTATSTIIQQQEKPDKKSSQSNVAILNSKVEEIKNKVTFSDKVTAAAMVVKRLSASEISDLNKMASNGISKEEKEKAKQLVYSKFTSEEVKQIKSLYNKYMN